MDYVQTRRVSMPLLVNLAVHLVRVIIRIARPIHLLFLYRIPGKCSPATHLMTIFTELRIIRLVSHFLPTLICHSPMLPVYSVSGISWAIIPGPPFPQPGTCQPIQLSPPGSVAMR